MSRARSCRCGSHADQHEIRDTPNGDQVAEICNVCHRFVSQRCRVCWRDFRDLQLHLAKSECGPFDKAGMWCGRPSGRRGPEAPPPQRAQQLELGRVT